VASIRLGSGKTSGLGVVAWQSNSRMFTPLVMSRAKRLEKPRMGLI
jgi:hypothetical protein